MAWRLLRRQANEVEEVSKKVPLIAYVVYSPWDYNPQIFFGGVASSCASETAAERNGFIVTLSGEVDMHQFTEMWQEQVEYWKEQISTQTTGDPKWRVHKNEQKQATHVKELMNILLDAEKELEKAKAAEK